MEPRIFKANSFYHIFNKSIAHYRIFKSSVNSQRFIETLEYYSVRSNIKFSIAKAKLGYAYNNLLIPKPNSIIKFICYCIMPDHYHILVKIISDKCLSKYINDVENSFSRYINSKNKRKGPIWQSRFKSVLIKNNEQLLHLTRYIHLNPCTASLVDKPENWKYSSYNNYLSYPNLLNDIITEVTITNPTAYEKFTENNINYQRKLHQIKKLLLE